MNDDIYHNRQGNGLLKEREVEKVWAILNEVVDPEIPVLSVTDLGIVRSVRIYDEVERPPSGGFEIIITPTYSGCPAMDTIRIDIRLKLAEYGYKDPVIKTTLSPVWTTDWMSEAGKEKLRTFGIAPPNVKQLVCDTRLFAESEAIECPHCRSYHTKLISRFGSTACKSLYKCLDCEEAFDYFKCH